MIMKTYFFTIIIYLCFSFFSSCEQEPGEKENDEESISWDYPVKPGTEAWKKLKDYQERIDICQIPEYVLQKISTKDLATLCLQYPFLYDVFAFNGYTIWVNHIFTDFNGIREFYKRRNAANMFQERYLATIHGFPESIDPSFFELSILEILLGYPDFSYISKEKQKKILKNLLFGYEEKRKYPAYFQGSGFDTNLFARAHIIIKIDAAITEKFQGENRSVLYRGMATTALRNMVDSLSYALIK